MRRLILPPLVLVALAVPTLADDAAEIKAIEQLRKTLPDARKGELADRLARLKDPVAGFRVLIGYAAEQDIEGVYDRAAYDAYLAGFRKLRSKHPDGFYFAALQAAGDGKQQQAFDLFKATLDHAPAATRDSYFENCVRGMATGGRELAAYSALQPADRRRAFRLLAGRLYDSLYSFFCPEGGLIAARRRLDQLVAVHAEVEPKDPRLLLVRGQLAHQERDWKAADDCYARYLATTRKPEDLPAWAVAFYGRADVGFAQGRGLEMYRLLAPTVDRTTGRAVFARLEEKYEDPRDAVGYAALLAEHERRDPTDPDLGYYRAAARWVARDYSKAANLYRAYLEPTWAKGDGRPKLGFGWYGLNTRGAPERLIRSLLRAGRAKEVPAVWAKMGSPAGPFGWFGMAAATAAGDALGAIRAADAAAGLGGNLATFHGDPDLGPLLRSDAFAAFRVARPEPPGTFRRIRD